MTLKPEDFTPIPEETVRVAKAVFRKGNLYMRIRDELGTIYSDEEFKELFSQVGQGAQSPGRLALVSVMQFAEGMSDREAADAVRGRIDWKYMLGLALDDPGFNFSVLSEFRSRLIAGGKEEIILNKLLEVFKAHKLIKERGLQRTDSTHVLTAVRRVNRLEKVGETLRFALNSIAQEAPEWLKALVPQEWYSRYGVRMEIWRLPKREREQEAFAEQIGADGRQFLLWVYAENSPSTVRENKAVETLRQVWIQEYYQDGEDIFWRQLGNLPPGEDRISTPYDPEARYSEKRNEDWVGYKVHLTETCEEETPNIIVQIETSPAPQPDNVTLPTIQADLVEKAVPPAEQLIDKGYMAIGQVVKAQRDYGISILGHPMPDTSWQLKEARGFDIAHFAIDWEHQVLTCPTGKVSSAWKIQRDRQGKETYQVIFSPEDCEPCPQRAHCTRRKEGGRTLTLLPQVEYEILTKLRQVVHTKEFQSKYKKRAGIEGTISQSVRALDIRRARYIGLAKIHLQHIFTAVAINFFRAWAWFSSIPVAKTRISPFASLATLPC